MRFVPFILTSLISLGMLLSLSVSPWVFCDVVPVLLVSYRAVVIFCLISTSVTCPTLMNELPANDTGWILPGV